MLPQELEVTLPLGIGGEDGFLEQYTYDPIYQLTQVTRNSAVSESYSYDAVGNRLSSLTVPSLTYNSSNELISTSRSSYAYDYNGNLVSKTNSSGATSYAWDYENRLASVTLPGSGGTVSFKYDPFGRRIQKSGPAGTTNFLYDGANIVADLDVSGTVLARYTQGSGIDEPLASVTGLGAAFFEADGLGSVTSLSGASGITDTYTYKPFGITTANGSNPNRFRFTGREWDQETGLYYYRARYYDPQIGRFISEDPLGAEGDGPNFYGYVSNAPIDYEDPLGLAKRKLKPAPAKKGDSCPPEKRCFFNWLDGPLTQMSADLHTTKALMFTMAAKEGGWTQDALDWNMPLNNPFGWNDIDPDTGKAIGNHNFTGGLSEAIDTWRKSKAAKRIYGAQTPDAFVQRLQHPQKGEGPPYNTKSKDSYDNVFLEVYKSVKKFMRLCGIND